MLSMGTPASAGSDNDSGETVDKTALALLEVGDIEGLLQLHRSAFGDTKMTAPAGEPAVVIPAPPPAPAPVPQRVDMSDPAVQAAIEAARKQEKDKLYETIEQEKAARLELEKRMEAFTTDLTARQQAEQEALAAAAAAAEEKRLAELSFGEKLTEFQQQQEAKLQGLEAQIAQRDALLAKEQEYNRLMQYKNVALTNEDPNGPGRGLGPSIIPQMRDLVAGNTPEEIEASISALAERSASILEDVAAATGSQRQQARGVGVTAPPVGPLDNDSGYQTLTHDELKDMDMGTYAQLRGRLLGAAANTQQRDRGMFG